MNRPITILIVDDDAMARKIIKHYVAKNENYIVLDDVANTQEAMRAISDEIPDVIFLDISMPQENGIDFAIKLKKLDIKSFIIFTTSYTQYALDAFEISAFDYLIKPIKKEALLSTLENINQEIDRLSEFQSKLTIWGDIIEKLEFKIFKGNIYVQPNNILYAKTNGNNAELKLLNNRSQRVYITVTDLYIKLHKFNFFKINRSTLVNLNYVTKIDKKQRTCIVSAEKNDCKFIVSRENIKFLDSLSSLKLG